MGSQNSKDKDPDEESVFICCGTHRDSRMLTRPDDAESGRKQQQGILKNNDGSGTARSETDPNKVAQFKSTFVNAYYPSMTNRSTTTFGPGTHIEYAVMFACLP